MVNISKSLVKKDEKVKKFPIKKVHESLQAKFPNEKVIEEAAVYHSGILEYLTIEILEISANVAKGRKKGAKNGKLEISLNDVQEAIQSDKDMRDLVRGS